MGNALIDVVHHHRQLVSVEAFLAQDDRIVEFRLYLLLLRAQQLVLPVAGFVIQGEPDRERLVSDTGGTATAVIRVAPAMGLQLFARTPAAVGLAGLQQLADGGLVGVMTDRKSVV